VKKVCVSALAMALIFAFSAIAFADSSRDWSLMDTRGESFKLSSVLGEKPAMLVFWATWCAPCKKEMADNQAVFDTLAAHGVNVILVSEDTQKTQAKVKPYVDSKGFTWRVLLDPDGEVLKRYGGLSIPYTVVLDKQGNAVQKYRGAVKDTEALTKQIDSLLGRAGE
jgi:cytochrome c biogenesis protein CcmG, thiol:disulfide interchange protein DsbE